MNTEKTTEDRDAVVAQVERPVRPLRWLCQSCDWTGEDAELLRAPSPFDAADTICACPKCKAIEDIANACDEPGCAREATCGFPDHGGYRRTCGKHFRLRHEQPNVGAKAPT